MRLLNPFSPLTIGEETEKGKHETIEFPPPLLQSFDDLLSFLDEIEKYKQEIEAKFKDILLSASRIIAGEVIYFLQQQIADSLLSLINNQNNSLDSERKSQT